MIELNEKTQQDFLSREWVQKLLDVGVDMSDAKYCLLNIPVDGVYKDYINLNDFQSGDEEWKKRAMLKIPTYTVSELLYKLHEWIRPTIDGVEYSGMFTMYKDAPFYPAYYDLKKVTHDSNERDKERRTNYLCAIYEYPIESLASLLIQCHQKDIGFKDKDTGDISDK